MGSSPCRRISLLGIAHPVVGKYFQLLEVHKEMKHTQDLSYEKGQILSYSCIFYILDRISSFVYVNETFCDKNLFLDLFSVVLIVSQILYCMQKCV